MVIKKGTIFETTITDLAFGGRGLVRIDNFAVFVDPSVPGDRVQVRVFKKKKNYAEARVVSLLAPSVDRVTPPCRYSDWCGGCKSQFLSYDKQLEYKRRQVADSLDHIGALKEIPVHPVIGSQKVYGYRNKMEFSCTDRRWLLPEEMTDETADRGFALGLHVPGTFYKVLDIDTCLLMPDLGNRILSVARDYMKASSLAPYGLRSHEGFWRFLMLRHSVANDQWMVNIVTADDNRKALQPLVDKLMNDFPKVVSVVNNINTKKAGIALGEVEYVLGGLSRITDRVGKRTFHISANSFFQTNTRSANLLYGVVERYANLNGNETVMDLYCGTGSIAITLAENCKLVTGFEISEAAIEDARQNCRLNGISNCRFIQGDVRYRLSDLESAPEVMIIDPPRAGMHKDVVKQVLSLGPERIIYVSCNPATLARDLGLMTDAYKVLEVQPVDMFPHTWHIEAVARLKRQ